MHYKDLLDDLSGIRGYEQLVQNDESIKSMLAEEYSKTGNKVASFYKVRSEVISNKFLDEELKNFISIVVNEKGKLLSKINPTVMRNLQTKLFEKVLRDHIPYSAIEEVERALFLLYTTYGNNAHVLFNNVKKYIQSEKPTFAHVLKRSLEIIEKYGGDVDRFIEDDDSEIASSM